MAKPKLAKEIGIFSHADYTHKKAKARTSNRRQLTENIKKQRMKSTKQYSYGAGYGVIDTEPIRERVLRDVPEHTVPIRHLERIQEKYWDEKKQKYRTIETFKWVTDGYKTIPAHTRKVSRYLGEKAVKPHLKRWHINKKWYRNHAARKVRRTPIDTNINNSNYKKFYDIKWAIW